MAAKEKPNPLDVFTSADRFERLTREEIADILNSGFEKDDFGNFDDCREFDADDVRLTDEVCYTVVNEWSNNGDPIETTLNTLEEHPDIRS